MTASGGSGEPVLDGGREETPASLHLSLRERSTHAVRRVRVYGLPG